MKFENCEKCSLKKNSTVFDLRVRFLRVRNLKGHVVFCMGFMIRNRYQMCFENDNKSFRLVKRNLSLQSYESRNADNENFEMERQHQNVYTPTLPLQFIVVVIFVVRG